MPRKEAVITETIAHLVIDLACFFLLAGNFTKTAQTTLLVGAGFMIFLILSYGLRPFLGVLLDEMPLQLHPQAVGCLLVALACLLPPAAAWIALFPAAVGSALFHVGALGESVSFARGFFSRNAAVISTGIFGGALGIFLARQGSLSGWMLPLLLLALALACFFFTEARKYPKKIRSFRNSVVRIFPDWAVLGLTLIPLFLISLVGSLLPADWTEGPKILIPAALCMVGRMAGGVGADRFGPKKTAAVAFGIALLLLTVFTHVPWLYCIGLGALCAPASICFGTATAALPERPHLAMGTASLAILLGTIPGFFRIVPTTSIRFLCAGLLTVALAVSLCLYTDHCRFFHLRKRLSQRKGETR
ncbi:MAG: hypothetical protein J6B86_06190 [Clostridia bacterium]|nr:hypothetical protein [Clostridia bacterium]